MQRESCRGRRGMLAALDDAPAFLYIDGLSHRVTRALGSCLDPGDRGLAGGSFMTWKRSVAAACLTVGLGARLVGAQEPTPTPAPAPTPAPQPPAGQPAAPPPPIEQKPKDSFFGTRFALYLEVRAGTSSADEIFTHIESTQNQESDSTLEYEDLKHGEFTIGWTLPRDRGQYLFTFTGVADDGYSFDATGFQRAYFDPQGSENVLENPLPWWQTSIRDGELRSVQKPPTWDSFVDDA